MAGDAAGVIQVTISVAKNDTISKSGEHWQIRVPRDDPRSVVVAAIALELIQKGEENFTARVHTERKGIR